MVIRENRGPVAVLRMQHGRANALDPEFLGAIGEALTTAEDAGAALQIRATSWSIRAA